MKQVTWNQHIVKQKNKEIVLHSVIDLAPLSRADIAQRSGLNKATVSSLVNELIEEELIFESGPGKSSGGRRPVILNFNQTAGYAIGIDIGVNYTFGIITDLLGNVLHESVKEYKAALTLEEYIGELDSMIKELIAMAPPTKYGVVGIGIGVPGVIDNSGQVLLAPNLKWINTDLKAILEEKFDLPIVVENEANAGAYGEKRFGVGKNVNNLIFVSAGIGIGVGLILNGELYRGINGYSGENGHMTIIKDGKLCNCGNKGCWEAYASENALLEKAKRQKSLNGMTLEQLIAAAKEDNTDAVKLFEETGNYLGTGVSNLIKTFNPEMLIIGNRLSKAKPWIQDAMINTTNTELLPFHKEELDITFMKQNFYATALGMAAFTIEEFLNSEHTV
ncbi:ROK family transcriptional regulator [Sporosarcina cascadiensis]|uniref:ROK family transcriptional regulator n=1 Tax=Sporosarcina cascadiensis TaxID=2660747 RepID=UPI00129A3DBB|nr:ROK family transcriptional regulator [Sporosarcina cascadiensis]